MTDRAEQPRVEQRHRDKANAILRTVSPGYLRRAIAADVAAALAEAEADGREQGYLGVGREESSEALPAGEPFCGPDNGRHSPTSPVVYALPPEVEAAVREYEARLAEYRGGRSNTETVVAFKSNIADAVLTHVRNGAPVERVCKWKHVVGDRTLKGWATGCHAYCHPQATTPVGLCGNCGGKIELEEAT